MVPKRMGWSLLGAVVVTVLGACSGGASGASSAPTTAPQATQVVVQKTATVAAAATDLVALKKTPASLAVDDPAWSGAPTTQFKTIVIGGSKATAGVTVTGQALYSDSDLWLRFEWPDATQSDTAVWQWDGSKWNSSPAIADRMALNWEITKIADFEAKGCQGICHRSTTDPIDSWYMGGPNAADAVNTWQWTAATSAPMGFGTDTKLIGGALPDPKNTGSTFVADKSDAGGGTVSNSAAAPATPGPLKMQDPSKPATYGPKYLAAADAMPIDMSKVKPGDTVPRTMLAPYTGAAGVIQTKSGYANGKWTVVFHRKLDTGVSDDVKFVTTQSYPFGLAVFNDLDHYNHTVTEEAFTLRFQ